MCEAESGFRYINGIPDVETEGLSGPPVRPNISLGDSIAGLHAAFGTVCGFIHSSLLASNKKYNYRSSRCCRDSVRRTLIPRVKRERPSMLASSNGEHGRLYKMKMS